MRACGTDPKCAGPRQCAIGRPKRLPNRNSPRLALPAQRAVADTLPAPDRHSDRGAFAGAVAAVYPFRCCVAGVDRDQSGCAECGRVTMLDQRSTTAAGIALAAGLMM